MYRKARPSGSGRVRFAIAAIGALVLIAAPAVADFYLVRSVSLSEDFGPLGNNPYSIAFDGTYAYLGGYTAASPSGTIGILKINITNPTDKMTLEGGTQTVNQFRYYNGLVVQNGILYALCDRPDGTIARTNLRAIDVATGALVETFDGDDTLNPGNGIVYRPAAMTNEALGGLAWDPGKYDFDFGLSILAWGRGRRVLIDATDGTTLYDNSTGMIVTDLNPVGCTVVDSSSWRGHVYDTNGDVYMRRSNQVQKAIRIGPAGIGGYEHLTDALNADGSPVADCGDGKPVALRRSTTVIGQNLALIQPGAGSFGQQLVIFNDHYSASPGRTFANTIKLIQTDGSLPSPEVKLLRGDGSPLDPVTDVPSTVSVYAFAYDASQDILLILDFASRNLLVFSGTLPPPGPPSVPPVLMEGAVEVTVAGLGPLATSAALYRNGTLVGTKATGGGATVVFTAADGVAPLVVGDRYTATQTTAGGTSDPSAPRCVVPAVLSLADAFEGAALEPCWQLAARPLELSAEQNHTPAGTQSAKDTDAGGEIGRDLTPTVPTAANPVLLEVWLYHESGHTDPAENQRHFASLANWSGDGYRVGVLSDLFSIGLYNAVSGTLDPGPFDVTKYQGRRVGGGTSDWFNLNDAGCPGRSTGWHKLSIKVGDSRAAYYVDGVRGRLVDATPAGIDSLYLGNQLASPDGKSAYFDDVSVSAMTNHAPLLAVTDIAATEGAAIVPTDAFAGDADSPDTVRLELSGTLPAGLMASATVATGNPATITISGTPEPGTAAGSPYTVNFRAVDDMGADTGTLTMTITISPPCHLPPQDADGDGDVDLTDFGLFQACFNGPNRPWPGPPVDQAVCACLDADADADVDLADFGTFQACFNGPNRTPSCP